MLLISRKLLQKKLLDVEADVRGTLRNFGLKVGVISPKNFEGRIHELVEAFPRLAAIVEPVLVVRRALREQLAVLHRMMLGIVRQDPIYRRLMTAPSVGPVVALTYRAAVDQPQRFTRSKAVGAQAGLTPKRVQSGETDYDVGISKTGDVTLCQWRLKPPQNGRSKSPHFGRSKIPQFRRPAAGRGAITQRRASPPSAPPRFSRALLRGARGETDKWVDETDFRWSNKPTALAA